MGTANVVIRLKPKCRDLADSKRSIQTSTKDTLLIRKSDSEDGLYQFSFTHVLADATQQKTYEVCGCQIVEAALEGYNGTVMAYGQTGAGKTYTMTGGEGSLAEGPSQGLIPRVLQQLFSGLKGGSFVHWKLRLSYLEIYNESFRDLLRLETPSADLGIVDNKGTISIRNQTYVDCSSYVDAEKAILQGLANRVTAGHRLNDDSSRSHTIVSLSLDMVEREGTAVSSKLNLVDLAGSERFAKTGTQGAMAKQAVHINKSLSFLEQTVTALAKKRQYVPFRSSKLTHFLKDSIGGNCKTLLIACIWSDTEHLSETLSTCRFAQRMMQVSEDAVKNAGGLSSVHGSLFKLDPLMQQYLESMTAAAVAREKAQIYAEFAQQRESHLAELDNSEMRELEALRLRVRELEMRGQSDAAAEREVADEDNAQEMEGLRNRVLQLERDIAAARDAAAAAAASFFNRAADSSGLSVDRNENSLDAAKEAGATGGDAVLRDGPVDPLQRSLEEPLERAVDETEASPEGTDEVVYVTEPLSSKECTREDLATAEKTEGASENKTLQHDAPATSAAVLQQEAACETAASGTQEPYDQENQEEEAAVLVGPKTPDESDTGHLLISSTSRAGQQGVEHMVEVLSGSREDRFPCEQGAFAHQQHDSSVYPRLALQSVRPPPSEVQSWGPPSCMSAWDTEFPAFHSHMQRQERQRKKKGLFSRLFGKKEQEHDSFAEFGASDIFAEEMSTPNIVILNSLNHNQLLELLKERPLQNVAFPATEERENWEPITPEHSKEQAQDKTKTTCSASSGGYGAEGVSGNIEGLETTPSYISTSTPGPSYSPSES